MAILHGSWYFGQFKIDSSKFPFVNNNITLLITKQATCSECPLNVIFKDSFVSLNMPWSRTR